MKFTVTKKVSAIALVVGMIGVSGAAMAATNTNDVKLVPATHEAGEGATPLSDEELKALGIDTTKDSVAATQPLKPTKESKDVKLVPGIAATSEAGEGKAAPLSDEELKALGIDTTKDSVAATQPLKPTK